MPSAVHPPFHAVTLIRRIHLSVRRHALATLHDAGYTDIAAAQIYVFQTPGPDGVRPTELARRTNMSKQAMNHLLAGLESAGYLERRPSDDDARGRCWR